MNSDTIEPLITTGEAARLAGVTSQTIVNWCDRGWLPHVRLGRYRRIRRSDLAAILTPHTTQP